MPAAPSGAREGIVIATGVLTLAVAFAWRQWVERRGREGDLGQADEDYFARKDRRRFAGTAILGLIGVGMIVGSLIDHRASKAAGQTFVWIWFGVVALVCISIVLALLDWLACRDYAVRHRDALLHERRVLLEEGLRRRPAVPDRRDGANGISGDEGPR